MRYRHRGGKYFDYAQTDQRLRHGLVGHWVGSGSGNTLIDRSGYNNHGTLVNGPEWTTGHNDKIGQALKFDGTDDYVNAGSGASLDDLTAFTYSLWVYKNENDTEKRLLSKYETYGGKGKILRTVESNFAVANGFQLTVNRATANALARTKANALPAFGWYLVTATYSSADGPRLYVNGAEVSYGLRIVGSGEPSSESANPLLIGNYYVGYTSFFKGNLDDVRVYNRALSQAEISLLASPDFNPTYAVKRRVLTAGGASGPANLKSRSGNLKANIKSMSGNLLANIKSLSGNA